MLTLPLFTCALAFVLGAQTAAFLIAAIMVIGERDKVPPPIPAPTTRLTFASYERWLAKHPELRAA